MGVIDDDCSPVEALLTEFVREFGKGDGPAATRAEGLVDEQVAAAHAIGGDRETEQDGHENLNAAWRGVGLAGLFGQPGNGDDHHRQDDMHRIVGARVEQAVEKDESDQFDEQDVEQEQLWVENEWMSEHRRDCRKMVRKMAGNTIGRTTI